MAAKDQRFKDTQALTPAKCIWVYDQADLQGNKREICESTDLSQTTWNDKIVSFCVGSEINGYFYEGPNYTGKFLKFMKSTVIDNLSKFSAGGVNLKNIISSVYFGDDDIATKRKKEMQPIIPAKCIWVFDQVNFFGNKLEICGSTDLTTTNFNKKIASFLSGAQTDAFFYENQNYSGRTLKFAISTANVDLGDLKNIFSNVWFGTEDYIAVKGENLQLTLLLNVFGFSIK